ncbi:MAG: acyltransferase family protein [Propioniciclava sp.]
MTPVTLSRPRFAELDGLRGVAAMAVVAGHLSGTYDVLFSPRVGSSWTFPFGAYGVQLFFLISGFVILLTARRTPRPTDFGISRLSRLYPAYWAALAAAIGVAFAWPLQADPTAAQILVNLTMVQRWFLVPDINDVSWTLAVEMQFYGLVFALLLLTRGRLGSRVILSALVGWVAVALGVAAVIGWQAHGISPGARPFGQKILLNLTLAEFAPLFAAGCLAFLARGRELSWWWPITAMGSAVAVAAMLEGAVHAGAVAVVCLVFLAVVVPARFPLLDAVPVQWLGQRSYSIYLVHTVVGYPLIWLVADRIGRDPATIVAIVGVLVISDGFHHLGEVRGTRALRRLLLRLRDRGGTRSSPGGC